MEFGEAAASMQGWNCTVVVRSLIVLQSSVWYQQGPTYATFGSLRYFPLIS
jgi:hypothetical protein